MIVRRGGAARPEGEGKLSPIGHLKLSRKATNDLHQAMLVERRLVSFKSSVSKPSVNRRVESRRDRSGARPSR
jgi:hypothetical protein